MGVNTTHKGADPEGQLSGVKEGLPTEGDIILAGKYRVERSLGAGAMGVVVAARHMMLNHQVAIKFLLPEMVLQHDKAVARFQREAQAAAALQSEHVVRVSDVGALENGTPYLMMEYLTGADLARILETEGPLPIERAVDYVLQACEALAEAHAAGIVHRDLKPSNLFLASRADNSSIVKVLDFGISKISHLNTPHVSATLTMPGLMMGSPLYMSPEQIRCSSDIDARCDIWALGQVLQELLTGKSMFEESTFSALCARITADPPVPLRHVRPDAPQALEDAILRCLQKDPTQRFGSVAELALALQPFAPPACARLVDSMVRVLKMDPTAVESMRRWSGQIPVVPANSGARRIHPSAETMFVATHKKGDEAPGEGKGKALWGLGAAAIFIPIAIGIWLWILSSERPSAAPAPQGVASFSTITRTEVSVQEAPPTALMPLATKPVSSGEAQGMGGGGKGGLSTTAKESLTVTSSTVNIPRGHTKHSSGLSAVERSKTGLSPAANDPDRGVLDSRK